MTLRGCIAAFIEAPGCGHTRHTLTDTRTSPSVPNDSTNLKHSADENSHRNSVRGDTKVCAGHRGPGFGRPKLGPDAWAETCYFMPTGRCLSPGHLSHPLFTKHRHKQNPSEVQTAGPTEAGRTVCPGTGLGSLSPSDCWHLGEVVKSSLFVITSLHCSVSTGKVYTCKKNHPGKATALVPKARGSACPWVTQ